MLIPQKTKFKSFSPVPKLKMPIKLPEMKSKYFLSYEKWFESDDDTIVDIRANLKRRKLQL